MIPLILSGDSDTRLWPLSRKNLPKQFLALAAQDWLVTFGIRPDRPETGFGYIRLADTIDDHGFGVGQFVEKPDSLEEGERFQVKHIVVSGTAEVICDDKVFLLGENQSTYILLGS